jgi:hypothetical protein
MQVIRNKKVCDADVLRPSHCVCRCDAYMGGTFQASLYEGLMMAGFLRRLMPKRFRKEGIEIPVVRLQGAIMSGGSQFRPALNLASTAQVLEKAFASRMRPPSRSRSIRRAARRYSRG